MTEKEEKILIGLSFAFLFTVIALSIFTWKVRAKNERYIYPQSNIFTRSYLFQIEDGLIEGDIEMANELHADGFVKIVVKEDAVESNTENEDYPTGGIGAVILYNNEFVMPDYDSYDFARDLSESFVHYFQIPNVTLEKSEDEELKKAMHPAVIIESNLPMEEIQVFISDNLKNIFTEENNRE
ncbi:MAG: hypothetical protein IIX48_05625 [Lachnospiraceae bacterium]|nr:hypothetical protein [Lachnospiraceae bacterium]